MNIYTNIPIHWANKQSLSREWIWPLSKNGTFQCPYNLTSTCNSLIHLWAVSQSYLMIEFQQLYNFPRFLYDLASSRISYFWYGSWSLECLTVWWWEGLPPLCYHNRWKHNEGIRMDNKTFCVACQDNVECQFYCTGFRGEYGSFFCKAFCWCFILEYFSTSSSVAPFGAICINVEVVKVFLID